MGWERAAAARRAYWQQYGQMSEQAWFGPTNGPASPWPGHAENFVPIVTPTTGIVTTDGISSPYEQDDLGDELEVFVESPELSGPFEGWTQHFLMNVIVQGGMTYGGQEFRPTFDFYGQLTLRLLNTGAPADWLNEEGHLGVLAGVPIAGRPQYVPVDGHDDDILLVALTPLRPSELAWTLESQDRAGMAAKLVDAGYGHIFDSRRPALV